MLAARGAPEVLLLFDPDQRWTISSNTPGAPRAANIPWLGRELQGRVVACGLNC